MRLIVITAVCVGLATTAAHAEERRQHDAHEHGHASMQVVLEGAELGINIEAPGMDIVGFEHAPEDDADKGRIQQAVGQLENVTAMFALPEKALCTVTEAHAEHASLEADKDDDHSDHKDEHKHSGHKDEHKHSDHKDDHEDEARNHSAFGAHYAWRCEKPEALEYIDVRYLEAFPATAEIEAQIIGPNGQFAQELTAESARIKF
jgi:ABC-type Zn2+ transport system substrate-binding protein/surface adhesin